MIFKEEKYNNFIEDFDKVLRKKIKDIKTINLIVLCIGTNKVVGDSFGPLVGHRLKQLITKEKNIKIIGNLKDIVCYNNIIEIMESIKNIYNKYFIIAIDSTVSNKIAIGEILVSTTGVNVGSAIKRKNIYVGDMSIRGIVSNDLRNPRSNFKLLQNISIQLVSKMANVVAQGIYDVINV